MSRTVGQIVDGVGVPSSGIPDDTLVSGAVVLLTCVDSDGEMYMMMAHSGLNSLERVGLLRAAERLEGPKVWAAK